MFYEIIYYSLITISISYEYIYILFAYAYIIYIFFVNKVHYYINIYIITFCIRSTVQ